MGGTVAVEMATRLQRAGEEVALVILVDPRVRAPRSLAWLRVQASLTARKVATGDYSWKLTHAERRREVMSAVWRALGRPAPGTDSSRRAFEASMASIRAECVPSPYDGPLRLFATMDYPLREWFWAPLLADLAAIEELPHRHGSILRPPAVDDLADAIRAALADVESH